MVKEQPEQLIISVGREFGSAGHVIAEEIARRLDLPFYDPLMIIEKTGGRMAEDNFSIEIMR